jgi:cyclic lactone autoinducer peptide
MKKTAIRVSSLFTVMVFTVAVMCKWQPSFFLFHQPEAPESLKDFSLRSLKKYL